jgi:hypothetical protein
LLSQPELPAKSLSTLGALEVKKHLLRTDLSLYCINDHGCYNKDGAKDYLRSYCCSIFDFLKDAYSSKVAIWDWEEQIVEEAIRITLECWDHFNSVYPPASVWRPTLHDAIVQHLGRPIRQRLQRALEPPVNMASASPLMIMAETAGRGAHLQPPNVPSTRKRIGEELKRLLDESRLRPEDIAEEIDIEARNVYRHLAGETVPSLVNLGKYEKALSKHLGRAVKLPTPEKRHNVSSTSVKRQ